MSFSSVLIRPNHKLMDSGAYRDALITCRKHRLDLNLLHDLDPEKFMASLESFVDQVPQVDYLNLFVSSLKSVSGYMLYIRADR